MNLLKLQALLSGSFINATQQPATTSVQGFPVPGQEPLDYGGGFSSARVRKRPSHTSVRYIHPGFSDGTRAFKRHKKKSKYEKELEKRQHDLDVDPHIERKRRLDED